MNVLFLHLLTWSLAKTKISASRMRPYLFIIHSSANKSPLKHRAMKSTINNSHLVDCLYPQNNKPFRSESNGHWMVLDLVFWWTLEISEWMPGNRQRVVNRSSLLQITNGHCGMNKLLIGISWIGTCSLFILKHVVVIA